MLKELWAKMRGVDKWPEMQATVRRVERYELSSRYSEEPRKLVDVTFAYTDGHGDLQYGWITVDYLSDLFEGKEDDTFPIRVNPAHPDQYYSADAVIAEL
jgi:hypothetical protein